MVRGGMCQKTEFRFPAIAICASLRAEITATRLTMKIPLLSRLLNLLEFFANLVRSKPKSETGRGLLGMYFVESNAKRNKMNRERQ